MRQRGIWLGTRGAARAAMLLGALSLGCPACGQTPPRPGWSLTAQFGPGWTSNPNDLPGSQKGDAYWNTQIALSYRHPLWEGAALTGILGTGADWYIRDRDAGSNRLSGSLSFSQTWRGATLSLGATARTSMDQPLRAHDEASQDISLGLSRPITLTPDWTLIPSLGGSRRFYQDGTKNDIRIRSGLILARKWNAWTWRVGGAASYLLEDNTPILPRIRDRSWSLFLSSTYEWEKDRELGLRLAYARTYSTYAPNRYRSVTLAPQISATFRF
ncbi:MAG: hypothetical protein O9322_15130 [Beijerinckiaceae bacterium]|nr:hypothetical protein [Beijerinckiaceae bacterium]MCZ8300681.1 hypothetical protein [Beijerinckiaceae bacterium]